MTELFYHKETIAPDLSDEELADLFYSHLESENYPARLPLPNIPLILRRLSFG